LYEGFIAATLASRCVTQKASPLMFAPEGIREDLQMNENSIPFAN
jgi:hypothetical protein